MLGHRRPRTRPVCGSRATALHSLASKALKKVCPSSAPICPAISIISFWKCSWKETQGEGAPSQWKLAAWFGRATEEQLKVVFAKEEDRGKPYEIRDAQALLVPPERPQNTKAIPFHPEPSNKTASRAALSKGIGGAPVPLVAAEPGVRRLYSSMHQRFSFSLFGLEEKHFREFGARYSLAQMAKLPAGVYHLVLPFSAALADGAGRIVAVRHGERRLVLDLTDQNRKETLESLQGSGAPRLTLEHAQAQNADR